MFVKHGNGKIISVFKEEELDEKQKKAVKDLSEKMTKESSNAELQDNKKLES